MEFLTPPLPGIDSLPSQLTTIPHWVAWCYRQRPNESKPTKVPVRLTRRSYLSRSGQKIQDCRQYPADSTDPRTWSSLFMLHAAAASDPKRRYGVGFVVSESIVITGIDLDNCRDPNTGELSKHATEVLDLLGSYSEISPSGKGIRIFVQAVKKTAACKHAATGTEIYDRGRFFTVTGQRIGGSHIEVYERQEQLDQLCATLWPPKPPRDRPSNFSPAASWPDDRLLDRAMRSDRFRELWSGDTGRFSGDASRADYALASSLAFWLGPDPRRINSFMRMSGLVRAKWDRVDYLPNTIARAIAEQAEFFGSRSDNADNVDNVDISDLTGPVVAPTPDILPTDTTPSTDTTRVNYPDEKSAYHPLIQYKKNVSGLFIGIVDADHSDCVEFNTQSIESICDRIKKQGVACELPHCVVLRSHEDEFRHVICSVRCKQCESCRRHKVIGLVDHFTKLVQDRKEIHYRIADIDGAKSITRDLRKGQNDYLLIRTETIAIFAVMPLNQSVLIPGAEAALQIAELWRVALATGVKNSYSSSRKWAVTTVEKEPQHTRIVSCRTDFSQVIDSLYSQEQNVKPILISQQSSGIIEAYEHLYNSDSSRLEMSNFYSALLHGGKRTAPTQSEDDITKDEPDVWPG